MSKDDIFKQAAEHTAKAALNIKTASESEAEVETVEVKSIEEKALEATEQNTTSSWNKVKEAVNGRFADRLLKIMDDLPDREFVKVHLKLMEYVNPKITRKEIIGDNNNDNEIKVLIVQNQNEPQEKTIDVTHSSQE